MTIEELECVIEHDSDTIYGFCCYLTGNKEDADDLYQESFLKMMTLLEQHRYSEAAVTKTLREKEAKNYIIGIAIGIYKNELRKRKRRNNCSLEALHEQGVSFKASDCVERQVLKQEEYRRLLRIIDTLPEKQRIVLTMFYTVDMSVEEISNKLGIPKGTVKSRLHKARMTIQKEMESEQNGNEVGGHDREV